MSVSSLGGVERTHCCSPIFGVLHRAHLYLFLLSRRNLYLLWDFHLSFLCACATDWDAHDCCAIGNTSPLGLSSAPTNVERTVEGCACLSFRTTGAAGCSCALSADSNKEGVMFLIPECEKTLYQQGHERENCTAASPAFLPAVINEHRPWDAWL